MPKKFKYEVYEYPVTEIEFKCSGRVIEITQKSLDKLVDIHIKFFNAISFMNDDDSLQQWCNGIGADILEWSQESNYKLSEQEVIELAHRMIVE